MKLILIVGGFFLLAMFLHSKGLFGRAGTPASQPIIGASVGGGVTIGQGKL